MLKVGIIGFGKMGQIRFNVIKKLDVFKVVSIYDPGSTKKNKLVFYFNLNQIFIIHNLLRIHQ